MTLPTLQVEIDFSSGATFAYPLILDDIVYGILDQNSLGNQAADIVNISDMVMKCSTRRGRNRILSNFEAGTATVILNDPDSYFNPQNTSSPYYGKLLPLRKIRIFAVTPLNGNDVEVNLFAGYITSYDTGFYQGVDSTSTVTLQCVDGFRLLYNVSTGADPVPGCPAGQNSGARVNALLDYAGWPDSMRAINTGDSTMQADPGGSRSLLQAIQTIEQSEFGAFFMSRTGRARFLNRTYLSELADATARVYSDEGYYGTLPYVNLDFAYDDQLILNDVTVTRLGGTPQEIFNQDSIDTYFVKSGQRSDILVQTDQEANDQARILVASRKNADLRIDSMTLLITGDQSEEDVLINLTNDIYTLVNITKTMPGGSTTTSELFIQGVQFDITPNSWVSKVLTAEPIIQGLILDSQNQGVLDIDNLSY